MVVACVSASSHVGLEACCPVVCMGSLEDRLVVTRICQHWLAQQDAASRACLFGERHICGMHVLLASVVVVAVPNHCLNNVVCSTGDDDGDDDV